MRGAGAVGPSGTPGVADARRIEVPANRVSQIIASKRSITADTALRLGRYFGASTDLWMKLQKTYDLDLARQRIGDAIERIETRGTDQQAAPART